MEKLVTDSILSFEIDLSYDTYFSDSRVERTARVTHSGLLTTASCRRDTFAVIPGCPLWESCVRHWHIQNFNGEQPTCYLRVVIRLVQFDSICAWLSDEEVIGYDANTKCRIVLTWLQFVSEPDLRQIPMWFPVACVPFFSSSEPTATSRRTCGCW